VDEAVDRAAGHFASSSPVAARSPAAIAAFMAST
jgi:hypothetical protein